MKPARAVVVLLCLLVSGLTAGAASPREIPPLWEFDTGG
jgi:hypothetical protein